MKNLLMLLMAPPVSEHSSNANPIGTIIMMLVIFAIPLSWVIPYIVRKNRKNQTDSPGRNAKVRAQIEQLKDLATLKEQGVLTEEEFIDQKNKILGRETLTK